MESTLFPQVEANYNLLAPENLARLNFPIYVVQGAQDDVCPPKQGAHRLVEAMKNQGRNLDYQEIDGAGHSPHHPQMTSALVAATDRLRRGVALLHE